MAKSQEGQWAKDHHYLVDASPAIGYSVKYLKVLLINTLSDEYWWEFMSVTIGYYGKWVEYVNQLSVIETQYVKEILRP